MIFVHERETNMKKWRKVILAMLCVGVLLATTACGNANDNMGDDAANNTQTEQNDTNNNDVTEGKDNMDNNGGVIDDVGDATGNVIDDIGNGVENITDDITGNNNNNTNVGGTSNGVTDNNTNR